MQQFGQASNATILQCCSLVVLFPQLNMESITSLWLRNVAVPNFSTLNQLHNMNPINWTWTRAGMAHYHRKSAKIGRSSKVWFSTTNVMTHSFWAQVTPSGLYLNFHHMGLRYVILVHNKISIEMYYDHFMSQICWLSLISGVSTIRLGSNFWSLSSCIPNI